MINEIRKYMAKCPYLDEYTAVNVNYLVDKVKAYSINESAGYNPILNTYLNGDKEMQFQFNFDSKLYWNEEMKNNIDNSVFYEKIKDWLETNDDKGIYPEIEDIEPLTIIAITNGYIFATNADEAIYRINCKFTYLKKRRNIG